MKFTSEKYKEFEKRYHHLLLFTFFVTKQSKGEFLIVLYGYGMLFNYKAITFVNINVIVTGVHGLLLKLSILCWR